VAFAHNYRRAYLRLFIVEKKPSFCPDFRRKLAVFALFLKLFYQE
jgi:hypothetical protein